MKWLKPLKTKEEIEAASEKRVMVVFTEKEDAKKLETRYSIRLNKGMMEFAEENDYRYLQLGVDNTSKDDQVALGFRFNKKGDGLDLFDRKGKYRNNIPVGEMIYAYHKQGVRNLPIDEKIYLSQDDKHKNLFIGVYEVEKDAEDVPEKVLVGANEEFGQETIFSYSDVE